MNYMDSQKNPNLTVRIDPMTMAVDTASANAPTVVVPPVVACGLAIAGIDSPKRQKTPSTDPDVE
jgi:hypothetical protein